MKTKILPLVLSVIVILLAIVSCVGLPIGPDAADPTPKGNDHSGSAHLSEPENSPGVSGVTLDPSETSPEDSGGVSPGVTEDPSEDTSSPESDPEPSQGEISTPAEFELPYKTLSGVTFSSLAASEYDEYFKNSMFIGNSIMVHFYNFRDSMAYRQPGFLGKCAILASSNYSALEDSKPVSESSWHPKYGGVKTKAADAVADSGVDTVYLSVMALNEIALHNAATCINDNFNTTVTLINSIKAKAPGVKIVILSNTYMVYNYNSYAKLNNQNISGLNQKMLEYCNNNGLDFIDVSTFLMEGDVLADKYCRDYEKTTNNNGCHLTNDAYALWTATLRNYACYKLNNAWENPASMPGYSKNP